MNPKPELTSGPGVQIVEMTMDNSEDQDELNRRLRKPGEGDFKMDSPLNDTTTHESNGTLRLRIEQGERDRKANKGVNWREVRNDV